MPATLGRVDCPGRSRSTEELPMLDQKTVSLLWCPSCRNGGLQADCTEEAGRLFSGVLRCESCRAEYCVQGGIPQLKPIQEVGEAKWETWRNHIDGFVARRAIRQAVPQAQRPMRWRRKLEAFASFIAVPEGRML